MQTAKDLSDLRRLLHKSNNNMSVILILQNYNHIIITRRMYTMYHYNIIMCVYNWRACCEVLEPVSVDRRTSDLETTKTSRQVAYRQALVV